MDSASVFLFHLFANNQIWSRSHSEKIRKTLGPFPASAASNACDIVKQILSFLPEDWKCKTRRDSTEQYKPMKEFGHNIVFKYPESKKNMSPRNSSGYDSLSDDETVPNGAQKSELISGLFQSTEANPTVHVSSDQAVVKKVTDSPTTGGKYTGEWLKKECQSCSRDMVNGGLEWQDLYSALFELLSSSEDNSAIENNVSMIAP